MFKNLKIGRKLGLGFGVVLVLLAAVAVYNYTSFNDISDKTHHAQEACNNRAFAIEKEVDHLKWMAELSDLFLNDEHTEVTVQTDDHQCGLGKWLYSEETRQRCAEDPKLAAIVEKIEEPHRRLHQSAIHIDDQYVDFDLELKSLLADRWIDHLNWIKNVANSNLTESTFDGGLDPHQCPFGKWYYSYRADDPQFGARLQKWEAPHAQLHESAQKMVEAQKAGDWKEAARIYQEETLAALEQMQHCYHETHDWIAETAAAQEEAQATFGTETKEAVSETPGSSGRTDGLFQGSVRRCHHRDQRSGRLVDHGHADSLGRRRPDWNCGRLDYHPRHCPPDQQSGRGHRQYEPRYD